MYNVFHLSMNKRRHESKNVSPPQHTFEMVISSCSASSGNNTSGKHVRPVVVHICTSWYPFYPFYVVLILQYMQCPLRNKNVPSATGSILSDLNKILPILTCLFLFLGNNNHYCKHNNRMAPLKNMVL